MTAFHLNKINDIAKNINYINIPQYNVFNNQIKALSKRQRNLKFNTIGRMSLVNPQDTAIFYLKLILHKIKGGSFFKDLWIVNKTVYKWYKGAAMALGLIEDDKH